MLFGLWASKYFLFISVNLCVFHIVYSIELVLLWELRHKN